MSKLFFFQKKTAIVLLFFLIYMLPESPVWYKSKNQLTNADKSYDWLRLPKMTQSEIDNKQ